MSNAITIESVTKTFGPKVAVNALDLVVPAGKVTGFIGPNGAGKTTTLEILEGHRQRTAGEVSVLGFDPENGGRPFRERIGIVLQASALERELKVREVIAFSTPLRW